VLTRAWPAVVLLAACYPADGVAPPLDVPPGTRALVVVDARRFEHGSPGVAGAVGVALPSGEGQADAALVYEAADDATRSLVVAGFYPADLATLGLVPGRLPGGKCKLDPPASARAWAPGEAAWSPFAPEDVFGILMVTRTTTCPR
jgi:hypothetical protein